MFSKRVLSKKPVEMGLVVTLGETKLFLLFKNIFVGQKWKERLRYV